MKKITVIGPGLDVAFPGMSLLRTTTVAAGIAAFFGRYHDYFQHLRTFAAKNGLDFNITTSDNVTR